MLIALHTEHEPAPSRHVVRELHQNRLKARRCLTASRITCNEDVSTKLILGPAQRTKSQDRIPDRSANQNKSREREYEQDNHAPRECLSEVGPDSDTAKGQSERQSNDGCHLTWAVRPRQGRGQVASQHSRCRLRQHTHRQSRQARESCLRSRTRNQ